MTENFSLLAHMVPKITPQVENAATEALAYILNRSDSAMQSLNGLLQEDGFPIEPIVRVETQVTYPDGSIPDVVGYDKNNQTRLLVEAKFGAALGQGQAGGYAQLLNQPGRAVLMFLAPDRRIPVLWATIEKQMKEFSELDDLASAQGVKRARVVWNKPSDTDLRLILTSWVWLIDRLEAMEPDRDIRSDLSQLRGLARREDSRVFLPIHDEDLG